MSILYPDFISQPAKDSLLKSARESSANLGLCYCGMLLGGGVAIHGVLGATSAIMKHRDDNKLDWNKFALRCGEAILGGAGFVAMLSCAAKIGQVR